MRGLSPAAELAEPVFTRRKNPFRDRKLFLRVPTATLSPGDDVHRDSSVRGGAQPSFDPKPTSACGRRHVLKAATIFSSVCLASSALAVEAPRCASLENAQKAAGKDTAIAPLTPAQFHFLQGVYVLSPATPDGLPPGDGALLLTHDHGNEGLILWTLGPLVCEPMPAPKKLLDYLAQVKSGADGEAM